MTDRIDSSLPLVELAPPATLPTMLHNAGLRLFSMGECRILLTRENGLFHLSISTATRDPTWNEIISARYRILPNVRYMSMIFPPLSEYVNLHKFTFHLWEFKP